MVRRAMAVAAVVGLVAAWTTVAAAQHDKKEVAGTVMAVGPEGESIKVKTADGSELEFPVAVKAREVVKGLKEGDAVKLTVFRCPNTGKDVVVGATKVHPQTQVTGTVVAVGPEGASIKIKTADGSELEFPVAVKAREVVKGLKEGDAVKLTYVRCPGSGKHVVVGAVKVH